ncbi:coenzyme F420-0:L-glutamate ligase [Candidatus Bathyarchaeota archaeon]|nr:MAG: coenzyme F420-0:L-glutamate ligase [Candidatus Bathyarchaeota archaeon]
MIGPVRIIPVMNLPSIQPGDDLAKMIVDSLNVVGSPIMKGDVLVIGQKAVSKAENRLVNSSNVTPSKRANVIARRTRRNPAFVQLVLQDSKKIARAGRDALIVTTKQGFTCLNGGVDKSNVEGPETYALLPADPDGSARRIRKRLAELTKQKVAVIICDTNSRPFRRGQIEQAIGVAGLNPLVDYRGDHDLFGYKLKFKNVAVVDELASAAELVMGQGREMIPAAVIRGLKRIRYQENARSAALTVSRKEDLFRGTL